MKDLRVDVKAESDARTRWEKPQKAEAGHPRQAGPALIRPDAHGLATAGHTRRGPPSPAPGGLTRHAGSLSEVTPDATLPRPPWGSCRVSPQPHSPENPCHLSPHVLIQIHPTVSGVSPKQIDSCCKHSN